MAHKLDFLLIKIKNIFSLYEKKLLFYLLLKLIHDYFLYLIINICIIIFINNYFIDILFIYIL